MESIDLPTLIDVINITKSGETSRLIVSFIASTSSFIILLVVVFSLIKSIKQKRKPSIFLFLLIVFQISITLFSYQYKKYSFKTFEKEIAQLEMTNAERDYLKAQFKSQPNLSNRTDTYNFFCLLGVQKLHADQSSEYSISLLNSCYAFEVKKEILNES